MDKPYDKDERLAFEKWVEMVYQSNAEFDETRNCYRAFPVHMAWQAWRARAATLPECGALPDCGPDNLIERLREFAEKQKLSSAIGLCREAADALEGAAYNINVLLAQRTARSTSPFIDKP